MQRRFEIKSICSYTAGQLAARYPNLPSYEAFLQRLNRLSGIFPLLTERIPDCFSGTDLLPNVRLTDSFPVVMANAKRSSRARVANEFASKGYCSSKGIWYYGVKVHILGIKRNGTLPLSDLTGVTPAGDHDLNAFRQTAPCPGNCKLSATRPAWMNLRNNCLKSRKPIFIHRSERKKGKNFRNFPISCFQQV